LNNLKSFQAHISVINAESFEEIALELFHFQAINNNVYAKYIQALKLKPSNINRIEDIPFLPISLFKSQVVKTTEWEEELIFQSSGTSGEYTSKHYVKSTTEYLLNAERCFEQFYGPVSDYHFLALLPSYLERKDSSLVLMLDHFIRKNGNDRGGFYLNNTAELLVQLEHLRQQDCKVILWGVTFALLDLAEQHQINLSDCIIMETGGMKGRRKELTREEVHDVLCNSFQVRDVHSEYGMTELMSQAYAKSKGMFSCPSTMRVFIRDVNDPFHFLPADTTGGINIIDLANIHSCAFIETEDLGKLNKGGGFEVLGRFDQSDVRGCNLLFN
jgi:phenylacetate-coenzyme A ligase PaaK-like adenylate-forming protein